MEYRFNADEWAGLSVGDRVHRCRLMAGEALKLAVNAPPALKVKYEDIARDWEKLAREIELAGR